MAAVATDGNNVNGFGRPFNYIIILIHIGVISSFLLYASFAVKSYSVREFFRFFSFRWSKTLALFVRRTILKRILKNSNEKALPKWEAPLGLYGLLCSLRHASYNLPGASWKWDTPCSPLLSMNLSKQCNSYDYSLHWTVCRIFISIPYLQTS